MAVGMHRWWSDDVAALTAKVDAGQNAGAVPQTG
jgi:hypothetical protein